MHSAWIDDIDIGRAAATTAGKDDCTGAGTRAGESKGLCLRGDLDVDFLLDNDLLRKIDVLFDMYILREVEILVDRRRTIDGYRSVDIIHSWTDRAAVAH